MTTYQAAQLVVAKPNPRRDGTGPAGRGVIRAGSSYGGKYRHMEDPKATVFVQLKGKAVTLCGKEVSAAGVVRQKNRVTCPPCLRVLRTVRKNPTDLYTELFSKYQKFDDPDQLWDLDEEITERMIMARDEEWRLKLARLMEKVRAKAASLDPTHPAYGHKNPRMRNPRRDGTGPAGRGPRTGRGAGGCKKNPVVRKVRGLPENLRRIVAANASSAIDEQHDDGYLAYLENMQDTVVEEGLLKQARRYWSAMEKHYDELTAGIKGSPVKRARKKKKNPAGGKYQALRGFAMSYADLKKAGGMLHPMTKREIAAETLRLVGKKALGNWGLPTTVSGLEKLTVKEMNSIPRVIPFSHTEAYAQGKKMKKNPVRKKNPAQGYRYAFTFSPHKTNTKRLRWIRYGANMEAALASAKRAARADYPHAHGFLIRRDL